MLATLTERMEQLLETLDLAIAAMESHPTTLKVVICS